jgi:regulator of replication initiation timing
MQDHIFQLSQIAEQEANDFHNLLNSAMYETPEQEIEGLKKSIDILWDSNTKLKEENERLKTSMFGHLKSSQVTNY